MLDYKISYAVGEAGSYTILETSVIGQAYTAVSLTSGQSYKFKVQARNSVGYSEFSNEITVLAAQIPNTPNAPTTTFLTTSVQIEWTTPVFSGSPVTAFEIYIRQSDMMYSLEFNQCDGSLPSIVSSQSCTVDVQTLRDAPFSLNWGDSVFATIIAVNTYGDSATSQPGNGAVIITYPDAPINLAEIVELRTSTSISFNWSEGLANGGSAVTDYRIGYD